MFLSGDVSITPTDLEAQEFQRRGGGENAEAGMVGGASTIIIHDGFFFLETASQSSVIHSVPSWQSELKKTTTGSPLASRYMGCIFSIFWVQSRLPRSNGIGDSFTGGLVQGPHKTGRGCGPSLAKDERIWWPPGRLGLLAHERTAQLPMTRSTAESFSDMCALLPNHIVRSHYALVSNLLRSLVMLVTSAVV